MRVVGRCVCELLEGRFADAAGGADEDCDEVRGESGRDEVVRGLDEDDELWGRRCCSLS